MNTCYEFQLPRGCLGFNVVAFLFSRQFVDLRTCSTRNSEPFFKSFFCQAAPFVKTGTVKYDPKAVEQEPKSTTIVPVVPTEAMKVAGQYEDESMPTNGVTTTSVSPDGEIVSSQTVSSKTRTVETVTVSGIVCLVYPSS